jgi:demethylmenaquinone methyltransferase/2-methoxy-6-polyprenyl-1,4-benzoquinol methylase
MLRRSPPLPDGWEVRHGNGVDLPFARAEFDVAIAAYVLHVLHDETVPRVLGELARVLRPGGRLDTVTPIVPARGAGRAIAKVTAALARLFPRRLGGLRPLDPTTMIEAAGFTIERALVAVRGYPSICILALAVETQRASRPRS